MGYGIIKIFKTEYEARKELFELEKHSDGSTSFYVFKDEVFCKECPWQVVVD